jgi:hypothetical protein
MRIFMEGTYEDLGFPSTGGGWSFVEDRIRLRRIRC